MDMKFNIIVRNAIGQVHVHPTDASSYQEAQILARAWWAYPGVVKVDIETAT